MLQSSEILNEFYDDPKLDYVRFVAFKYMPDMEQDNNGEWFTSGCQTGADIWGAIRKGTARFPFERSDYDNNVEIQKSLNLIGLDKECFWNALLFIHHMWESKFYDCHPVLDSDQQLLEQFKTDVTQDGTSLFIKPHRGKSFKIDSRLQNILIGLVVQRLKDAEGIFDPAFSGNPVDLADDHRMEPGVSWQIYNEYKTYHELFDNYCTDAKKPKRIKGQEGSRNKDLLISRIIYLTGLTRNNKFNETVDALHSVVQKCKRGKEPQTAASRYLF